MKHRHEKWIHLMANGVRIERKESRGWVKADFCCFDWTDVEFRISTNQLPDAEGWIPWHGGENPAVGKIVCIKCRVGGVPVNFASNNLDWRHKESEGDIVAYRIVKQEKVVLYQWIIYSNNDKHPVLTSYFYPDETALHTVYKNNLKIVHRAEWTRIEVEK